MREKSIYNMKLHDELGVGVAEILRVPGGWIYTIQAYQDTGGGDGYDVPQTVFVPYHTEFKEKVKK